MQLTKAEMSAPGGYVFSVQITFPEGFCLYSFMRYFIRNKDSQMNSACQRHEGHLSGVISGAVLLDCCHTTMSALIQGIVIEKASGNSESGLKNLNIQFY